MGNAYDQEQRIRDAKAKIAQRKPVEDAAQTAEINLAAREQAIADQFTSDIDPKDSQSYRIAQAKARVAVKQRQEQRAYAEQASPEMRKKTEDVLKYITNNSNRFGAIEALRAMPPEERDEVMRLAPGVMQQLGDDRGNPISRTANALWKGFNESFTNPLTELVGLSGSPEEVEIARQLEGLRQQEAGPSRADDWMISRGALGAVEMVPFAVAAARGGGLGRAVGSQAPALANAATGAAARGVFGAGTQIGQGTAARVLAGAGSLPTKIGLPALTAAGVGQTAGVTAASYPSMYIGEYHTLRDMGMEDNAQLRGLAGASALLGGAVESIIPDVFPGKVKLTQGVGSAVRQYLLEAVKKYPGELSEEGLRLWALPW